MHKHGVRDTVSKSRAFNGKLISDERQTEWELKSQCLGIEHRNKIQLKAFACLFQIGDKFTFQFPQNTTEAITRINFPLRRALLAEPRLSLLGCCLEHVWISVLAEHPRAVQSEARVHQEEHLPPLRAFHSWTPWLRTQRKQTGQVTQVEQSSEPLNA